MAMGAGYTGFMFRTDGSTGHLFYHTGFTLLFNFGTGVVSLIPTQGNAVAAVTLPLATGTPYRVRVVGFGPLIRVFVDNMNVPIISWTNPTPTLRVSGEIGVFNNWIAAHFWDFNVTELLDYEFVPPVAPVITDARLTGAHVVTNTLTANYVWYDENERADESTFQWFRLSAEAETPAANWNGVTEVAGWTAISGATNQTYTLTTDDIGSRVAAVIFPTDAWGVTNTPVPLILNETIVEWMRPEARNVGTSGIFEDGETLTGVYTWVSDRGIPAIASVYQWFFATEADLSDIEEISGETNITLVLTEALTNGIVIFRVTPRTQAYTGMPEEFETGETRQATAARPTPPEARNVRITSTRNLNQLQIGDVLTAEFDFFSVNMMEDEGTTFQWQRRASNAAAFVNIDGATGRTYTLTNTDTDHVIRVIVTPRRAELTPGESETLRTGTPVTSDYLMATQRPIASNVSVSGSTALNGRLTASYTFYHPKGHANVFSVYRWFRNGNLIPNANGIEYHITQADLGTTITFEVTPRTDIGPTYGTAVQSAGLNIPAANNSSGGFLGGGNLGGGFLGGGSQQQGNNQNVGGDNQNVGGDNDTPPGPVYVEGQRDIYGHWAVDSLVRAINLRIMQGSGGYMRPNDFVTRAEFTTMLVRALDLPLTSADISFADVTVGTWYCEAITTAAGLGIVQGDGVNFRPHYTITREEMTSIIINAYQALGGSLPNVDNGTHFADNAYISEWAVGNIAAAVNLGLVTGVSDTEFAPRGNATRAQAGVIILRVLDRINAGGNQ